ncbi:hypothetical protein NHH03_09480 [Stieleria sp. TO1_6]|uniref:hypothetical protein n=1 Tax=Stieleria tagensis TaxID=2956795 RepID=UPI00209AD94C|nr:hypothetical protein [Stieleria tagensis]MCO8121966.1 hypothetical protein [Stieleria tagensis]
MNNSTSRTNESGGKKRAGSIALVVVVCLYAFLQPRLNQRFGWNLPGLGSDNPNAAVVAERDSGRDTGPPAESVPTEPPTERSTMQSPAETSASVAPGPVATEQDTLRYGLLKEIGGDRFISPQGLIYTPGSEEGHRLEHLRRHTEDQPSRPGSHGVFDGGMQGALRTIDNAYAKAEKNQQATKQVDRNRTIYTVDMGQRVGYVGGRTGQQKRHPMARRVKMVLEGKRVITAYPL